MSKTVIRVNDLTWTDNSVRKEKPCEVCKTPTRGRIGFVAYCRECGMAEIMKPLRVVGEMIRGLFR